jgi:hypothetical protein
MELTDILTIIAIIVGPIAAVQIEKYLQRNRDSKNRKESIFKTLMATRGTVLSYSHVEALNRIDLEFSNDKKYKKIIDSWKEYFDNLSQHATDEQLPVWSARNDELLANLLYEMGKAFNYKFDKVLIKRNVYSPVGHSNVEREQQALRHGIIDLLNGNRAVPMTLIQDDDVIKNQQELQAIMRNYYEKNTPKEL